jgi:hypothetical protein
MHIILLIIKKSKKLDLLKISYNKNNNWFEKSNPPKDYRNRKFENTRKLSEIPGSFPRS